MRDTCLWCHARTLVIISCEVSMTGGVPLSRDGFALSDAKQQDTTAEIVQCTTCQGYQTIRYEDYSTFDGNTECSDPSTFDYPGHNCYYNDQVCGCQCQGCIDETEPRCVECNAILEDGRCPL